LYACGFRICFTPLPGFFSPFPHGTGSLSVDHEYLALEDGPPIFRQDFTCPALLVASLVPPSTFHVRGCHPLRPHFPERSIRSKVKTCRLFRVRSPLLAESRLISVPPATEMFQFTGLALPDLCIQPGVTLAGRVSPFGHLRINACLPTPLAGCQQTSLYLSIAVTGFRCGHARSACPKLKAVALFNNLEGKGKGWAVSRRPVGDACLGRKVMGSSRTSN